MVVMRPARRLDSPRELAPIATVPVDLNKLPWDACGVMINLANAVFEERYHICSFFLVARWHCIFHAPRGV